MNRRQRMKAWKQLGEKVGVDLTHCESCGKKLDVDHSYHRRYNVCNARCFADNVGVNLYEF